MTWDELAAIRWGPAKGDPVPGCVIDRPDLGHQLSSEAWWAAALDNDAIAERQAIQAEGDNL